MMTNSESAEVKWSADDARSLAQTLAAHTGLALYARSIIVSGETGYFLGHNENEVVIGVWGKDHGRSGEPAVVWWQDEAVPAYLYPVEPTSLDYLRQSLACLRPQPLGLAKSIGLGDRLGMATPGHVRAVRMGDMAPVFAQQSVRENHRTGRSPQEVLNDATLGVFQEGWTRGYGADADHIKTKEELEPFVAAGYSLYTFDAGDHVDDRPHTASAAHLQAAYEALPWTVLESSAADALNRFTKTTFDLGSRQLAVSPHEFYRAAVKYGRAVAHTALLARRLAASCPAGTYEIEMSVDETALPTSAVEHLYIAHELRRLGVKLTSLAPRYSGRFEKGVDFIGDVDNFATEFELHLAIARRMGPYKLSLHSGSDKFKLYPVIARLASDGLIHVKTAGTSYLEAVRTIARVAPDLFREILALAFHRFDRDRASYLTSAEKAQAPDPATFLADKLPGLLDDFHVRQILHVTFGSVLQDRKLKAELLSTLRNHQAAYDRALVDHFEKHILPFKQEVR